ncbi:hypothetical protein G6F23_013958 [Rhizopus arrhizus]|nr:hypothetical protein G6F23_013958 [Rhizopus arrhizus]
MAFPSIAAVNEGFQVFAVIDASGTYSKMAQEITLARVVQAGIQAPHAEDRHQVAGVTGEQHAAMPILVQRQALGVHVLGLDGFVGVFVVSDLIVHAPHVARLPMHQQRRPGVGRGIEPGQALDGAAGGLLDIDDDVAAFVLHAFQFQTHRFAHRAASAVEIGRGHV